MLMVLTCAVMPGTPVVEGKQDYPGNLALKSIRCMQMNLARFQESEKQMHHELWQCAATPGDCKIAVVFPCEQPKLLFVMADFALEACFGSINTMNLWLQTFNRYSEEGLSEWLYEAAGGGGADGGKKKKK